MPYRVFISHSSQDTWVAKQIERSVRECGAQTFLDAYDIKVGDNFEPRIVQGIEASDELLVLYTRYALESHYVTTEIAIAASRKLRISPITYDVDQKLVKEKPFLWHILFTEINDLDHYFDQLCTRLTGASTTIDEK